MTKAHRTEDQCAAYGCRNTRKEGQFVGDFCAPCDRAIRTGNFGVGTSVVFKHARVVNLVREYVKELTAGNSVSNAWGSLLRAIKVLSGKSSAKEISDVD